MSQSEYIDVMTLVPKGAPHFTVDKDKTSVDIRTPSWDGHDNYQYWMYSAGGKSLFVAGDNLIILSLGLVLPESFILSQAPAGSTQNNPSIALGVAKESAGRGVYFIPNFGVTGVQIPIENYELPVNIFVDINSLVPEEGYPFRTNRFGIYGILRGLNDNVSPPQIWPQVSMIGVPDELDGTVQHLTFFAKVLHNFPL